MAEPRLSPRHLAAPRKLILLVRIAQNGDYEAVTLSGEVALIGKTREEIKDKMRLQVRQMKASVRPTTVRLHFVADQRTWLHASLPEDEQPTRDNNAAASGTLPTNAKTESDASKRNGETGDTSAKSRSRKS
jgi:hypothetical protein